MFNNLSISRKLFIGFGAVVVIGALVGIYSITQINRVNQRLHSVQSDALPSVKAIGDLRNEMAKYRRTDIWQVSLPKAEDRAKNKIKLDKDLISFQQAQKVYEDAIGAVEERAMYGEFVKAWNGYMTEREKAVTLAESGHRDEAMAFSHDVLVGMYNDAAAIMEKLADYNMNEGQEEVDAGSAQSASARRWIIGSVVTAVVIGFAIAIFIARLVTRPVTRTVNVLEAVAKGDYSQTVAVESKDELGRMGLALNTTISAIKSSIEQVREAGEREQKQAAELRAKVDSILDVVTPPLEAI